MSDFVHPSQLTDEQRRQNLAAMHSRIAGVMSRVAADPKQSKRVRDANTRDAKAAKAAAARLAR